MAHGTPDWGVTAGARTIYQMTDLAELAARLGSIVTFDRRGDVFALEDFEDGLPRCYTLAFGAGADVQLSSLYARSGRLSAKLLAGSVNDRWAYVGKYLALPNLSLLGLEASFSFPAAIGRMEFEVILYTGSQVMQFGLAWRDTDNALLYRQPNGTWLAFASGVDLIPSPYLFHTLKLVFDPEDSLYVRALLNAETYDLSAYVPYVTGSGVLPYIFAKVTLNNLTLTDGIAYVDDLILTQNEPAQP